MIFKVLILIISALFTMNVQADISKARLEELKYNAFNVGKDYGFIAGIEEKKRFYTNKSDELDDVFNFSKLMIEFPYYKDFKSIRDLYITKEGTVLIVPGVLENVMIVEDKFDVSKAYFKKKPYLLRETKDGKPNFPNWRNYIFPKHEKNKSINPEVVPINTEEQIIWDKLFNQGFVDGRKDSFDKIDSLVKSLGNMKIGMVVYRQVYGYKIDEIGMLLTEDK